MRLLIIITLILVFVTLIVVVFASGIILDNRSRIDDNRKEINRIYKMMEEQGKYLNGKFSEIERHGKRES